VPDPQDPATFARSVLRWDEVTEPGHAEILDWYRELIALRRSRPELAAAPLDDVEVEVDEDADRVVVRRRAAGVEVVVDLAAGDVAIRT
jgi:maltooligosyltrehalose trehalohydrolase